MSHLGLRILYHVINSRDDASCERVFAPWDDMERLMRAHGIPLFALESRDELRDFDILGFTLQYELSYSNVLNMLDLAGINPLARERGEDGPLVCAGGPCACNPMPMAPFIDFFVLGEGEEAIGDILDLYRSMKDEAAAAGKPDSVGRAEFLRRARLIDGVYVPSAARARTFGPAAEPAPASISAPAPASGAASEPTSASEPVSASASTSASVSAPPSEFASAPGAASESASASGPASTPTSESAAEPAPAAEPVPMEARARKRVVADMDAAPFPDRGIVPFGEIVHDRVMLELFRGCIRGCRFCQAGYIYRPVRQKKPGALVEQACALVDSTGYEEISLTSLSTSDYSGLRELTDTLVPAMRGRRVNLSLPSLRVDSFSLELAKSVQSVRKSGLTFAPEAGTQRLRDAINKGVTEEDLLRAVSSAFNEGWSSVKLYFMIGLPGETYEDLDGIADLAKKVASEYHRTPKERRGRGLNITISASSFVPKPFTPFQWEAQDTVEALAEKQRYLKDRLKLKHVTYNWHDAKTSFLEAVFARGDARVGEALHEAWKSGAKFDGWSEFFRFDNWMAAFEKAGVSPQAYANRQRAQDEPLPWDVVDYGVRKQFLWRERERAYAGELTPNCREACAGCGVDRQYGCAYSGRAAAEKA